MSDRTPPSDGDAPGAAYPVDVSTFNLTGLAGELVDDMGAGLGGELAAGGSDGDGRTPDADREPAEDGTQGADDATGDRSGADGERDGTTTNDEGDGRTPERASEEEDDPDATAGEGEDVAQEPVTFDFEPDEDGFIFNNGISRYKNVEDMVSGLDAATKALRDRTTEVQTLSEQLSERDNLLQRYERQLPSDQLRDVAVRAAARKHFPEGTTEADADEMLSMTREELADDPEARAMVERARALAERDVADAEAAKKAKEDAQKQASDKAKDEAIGHVQKAATALLEEDERFSNAEHNQQLAARMAEKVEGERSYLEVAALLALQVGPAAADAFVEGAIVGHVMSQRRAAVRRRIEKTPTKPKPDAATRTSPDRRTSDLDEDEKATLAVANGLNLNGLHFGA